MNTNSLAWLAFRLMGIYTLLMSIAMFGAIPGFLSSLPPGSGFNATAMFLAIAIPIGFSVLVGVLLLTNTDFFVGWVVESRERADVEPVSRRELQGIGFSVLAVYLAGDALPRIAAFICTLGLARSLNSSGYPASVPSTWGNSWPSLLVRDVSQLALGVALFAGSKGLTRLWDRFQETRISSGPGTNGSGDVGPKDSA